MGNGEIDSRYNWPTFPRGEADFYVDQGRAFMPHGGVLKQLPGYEHIGIVHGSVTTLAFGFQSVESQSDELGHIRLFSNGSGARPLHHYAFSHGSEKQLRREAVIGVVEQCPGMLFDLNCGCGDHRDTIVDNVYRADAEAGVLLSLDAHTHPAMKQPVITGMLEALGVQEIRYPVNSNIYDGHECSLRLMLLEEPKNPTVLYGGSGQPYLYTHNVQVAFKNGQPARLLVFRAPPKEERRGFNRTHETFYVLLVGDIQKRIPVVRYHSECVTADHGSNACDCNDQRQQALRYMRENGSGVFIHAPEDGMGLGRVAKLPQTILTLGNETNLLTAREQYLQIPQDARTYEFIDIVRQVIGGFPLGARIASNNLSKRRRFEQHGIQIIGQYPMVADLRHLAPQAQRDIVAKIGSGGYVDYMASC